MSFSSVKYPSGIFFPLQFNNPNSFLVDFPRGFSARWDALPRVWVVSRKVWEKGKIHSFQKYLEKRICLEPLQYSFRYLWKKISTRNSWNPFPNNSRQPKAALKGSDWSRGAKILGFCIWNLAAGSWHIQHRDSEFLLYSRGFWGILWDGIGRCS